MEDYIDDNNNVSVVMATGLSQIPYDRTKFYYRLKNHKNFLENLILSSFYSRINVRDFIINFIDKNDAKNAENNLQYKR